MYNKRRRQFGLTIIELIMFMVIVGVAAAAILQVMNLANRNSTDPIRRKQAMLIAEAYMEEVQQAQFTACDPADANAATATVAAECADPNLAEKFGPEPGNERPFDNINDYVRADYVEGTPYRAFTVVANGVEVDGDVSRAPLGAGLGNVAMNGFVTTLGLRYMDGLGGLAASTVLQITITVNYGANESIVLQGYRTRYAPRAL
jgi:MSHA pilin protein MshD